MFNKISTWLYMRSVSKRREDEDRLIWNSGTYERLLSKQIEAILEIIDREIAKSYQFGLKLSHEHVLKEKAAVLSIVNNMGNLDAVPENVQFEEAVRLFSMIMGEIMKDEKAFYFEKLGKEERVRNMYNCHLSSVATAVLRAIYDKELPYI